MKIILREDGIGFIDIHDVRYFKKHFNIMKLIYSNDVTLVGTSYKLLNKELVAKLVATKFRTGFLTWSTPTVTSQQLLGDFKLEFMEADVKFTITKHYKDSEATNKYVFSRLSNYTYEKGYKGLAEVNGSYMFTMDRNDSIMRVWEEIENMFGYEFNLNNNVQLTFK